MKLHLVDSVNYRDETFDIGDVNCIGLWDEINNIVNRYNYSCVGYLIPKEINEKIITIHWVELFYEKSIPYIEIINPNDIALKYFRKSIKRMNMKHDEMIKKGNKII